jgi:hypothetical protein
MVKEPAPVSAPLEHQSGETTEDLNGGFRKIKVISKEEQMKVRFFPCSIDHHHVYFYLH